MAGFYSSDLIAMKAFHPNIAHFDLDSFFVSVEYLKNSKLKGKPIAVG